MQEGKAIEQHDKTGSTVTFTGVVALVTKNNNFQRDFKIESREIENERRCTKY